MNEISSEIKNIFFPLRCSGDGCKGETSLLGENRKILVVLYCCCGMDCKSDGDEDGDGGDMKVGVYVVIMEEEQEQGAMDPISM